MSCHFSFPLSLSLMSRLYCIPVHALLLYPKNNAHTHTQCPLILSGWDLYLCSLGDGFMAKQVVSCHCWHTCMFACMHVCLCTRARVSVCLFEFGIGTFSESVRQLTVPWPAFYIYNTPFSLSLGIRSEERVTSVWCLFMCSTTRSHRFRLWYIKRGWRWRWRWRYVACYVLAILNISVHYIFFRTHVTHISTQEEFAFELLAMKIVIGRFWIVDHLFSVLE